MHLWPIAITAFIASAVEAIEATTIVLAVGSAHTWRAALSGAVYAGIALVVIVGIGGPLLLAFVPLRVIRIVIGAFLIWFGYGWLRKSILRYAGRIAIHDEGEKFEYRVSALRNERERRSGLAVSFSGVFLEGLEVAIIVVTIGSASSLALDYAAAGAVAAAVLVGIAGFLVRRPFARIPENGMKFVVGAMLVSFGLFWLGEGAGVAWWHDDLSLLLIIAAMFAASFSAIALVRRLSAADSRPSASAGRR
jgi:uncharacterized membrane protein